MNAPARRHAVLPAAAASLLLAIAACSASTASPPATPAPTASPVVAVASVAPTPAPSLVTTLLAVPVNFTPGTVAKPRVVNLTGDDFLNFNPGAVEAVRGETVTFRITNIGKAEHEFMVGPIAAAFADKEGTPEAAGIKAGKTGSITVTFNKPGPYAFACHMPGHFEHGMLGFVIFVQPDVAPMGTVANPRAIAVNMTDGLKFEPTNIQVRKGETVRFVLSNLGKTTHEFMVGPADKVAADAGDGKITVEADELDAGSTHGLVYTFNGPGPYTFACHEPGHFEAGMAGTIELLDR
jgi:uncharacterized cupredoxin-like copper-binding protein